METSVMRSSTFENALAHIDVRASMNPIYPKRSYRMSG
jgi:hypothetical protein